MIILRIRIDRGDHEQIYPMLVSNPFGLKIDPEKPLHILYGVDEATHKPKFYEYKIYDCKRTKGVPVNCIEYANILPNNNIVKDIIDPEWKKQNQLSNWEDYCY